MTPSASPAPGGRTAQEEHDAAGTARAGELVVDLERAVIDGLRTPLVVATILTTLFLANEWRLRAVAPLQIVQAVSLLALTVCLRLRLSHGARKALLTGTVALQGVCALFHYGALMGTGVFLAAALLAAVFTYGARGAVVMWLFTTTAIVTCAALSLAGYIAPGHVPLGAREWVRVGGATVFALAMCGYVFWRVTHATRTAFARYVAVRREKQSAELGAQRLESLGRLAGGIAHELNNALQVVQSGASVLRGAASPGEPLSPDETARITADISRAVDAASATARRLLAFGRARPEDAGRSSPAEVVATFASSARRSLPPIIRLADDIDVPAGAADHRAIADIGIASAALDEVLTNLVANAADAMPGGGVVWLRVAEDKDDVVITVGDSGPGVAADVVDQVFDPFFTTRTGRNGLGLAAAWGIVTRVGGTIAYVAAPGEGARFEMRFRKLPAAAPAPAPAPAPAQALAPAPAPELTPPTAPAPAARGKRRLLLVEDEPDVARIFVRILVRAGYDVTAFERVAPALDALSSSSFDGLMTDVVVPGGGVPGLIDVFKKRSAPRAPVLVCSGHVEEDLVAHGIARGEYHFLRKPFAGPELVSTLAGLFADAKAPQA